MRGTVRLRIHWMKIGGKGLCSDAACLVATQYIALVREGTRERTGNWTAPLQHLPYQDPYEAHHNHGAARHVATNALPLYAPARPIATVRIPCHPVGHHP